MTGWAATNTLREGIVYSCDPISEAIGEGCGECAGCESYAALALVETALDAAEYALDAMSSPDAPYSSFPPKDIYDSGMMTKARQPLAAALRAVREGK